ncbi:hypothetical protein [Dermatobacter hominis]|uniref:hypothetical protein n=1 Tax=Dermatobacter hominis TaxID=2884263 RepID=UPI001D12BE11|nr:hypothetical protein [Dermatobacter hominis]UDY34981.1 hypothetical protein LH044_16780 [Dermatobacter hominis]
MDRPRAGLQHREIAQEAGLGRLSVVSVLAGVVTAYGTFAIVASIVGAVLSAVDVDTEFRSNDWTGSGAVAALATAVTLFVAYLFGGYVAGRMARRVAVLHGVCVFVLSLVLAAVVSGLVALLADDEELRSNLRSIGIPTTTDQITGVAIAALAVSVAAMLVGSVLGATLGERWHTKLARRAADPAIGPAAEHRRRAEELDEHRDERLGQDPAVARPAPVAPSTDPPAWTGDGPPAAQPSPSAAQPEAPAAQPGPPAFPPAPPPPGAAQPPPPPQVTTQR